MNAPNTNSNPQQPLEFPVVNPFDKPATGPKSPNNVHNNTANNTMNTNRINNNNNNNAYPGAHSTNNNIRPVNSAEFVSTHCLKFISCYCIV